MRVGCAGDQASGGRDGTTSAGGSGKMPRNRAGRELRWVKSVLFAGVALKSLRSGCGYEKWLQLAPKRACGDAASAFVGKHRPWGEAMVERSGGGGPGAPRAAGGRRRKVRVAF